MFVLCTIVFFYFSNTVSYFSISMFIFIILLHFIELSVGVKTFKLSLNKVLFGFLFYMIVSVLPTACYYSVICTNFFRLSSMTYKPIFMSSLLILLYHFSPLTNDLFISLNIVCQNSISNFKLSKFK